LPGAKEGGGGGGIELVGHGGDAAATDGHGAIIRQPGSVELSLSESVAQDGFR